MIKEIIGTTALLGLNNIGLILLLNNKGFLYYLGYLDYVITYAFTLFIITKYMESDFYKNLGKDEKQ